MPRRWPTYEGELDIGFPTGGRVGRETCRITLHDKTSRMVLLEVELDAAEFFRAITGRGRRPVTIEANPGFSLYIGARAETKKIPVFVPSLPTHVMDVEFKRHYGESPRGESITKKEQATLDLLDQCLSPYEVDGWSADTGDCQNWHCVVRDIPTGAASQLREAAGFDDDTVGDFREVTFRRHTRDGKPVKE